MDVIAYQGKEYHRDSKGIWRDHDNIKVYDGLQVILNKEWAKNVDIEDLSYEDLSSLGDRFKNSKDYINAIRCYEKMLEDDRIENRWMLATLSACYRSIGTSEKSVSLYEKYEQKKIMITPPFLTSVGAACLDMGKCKEAKYFADRAYALSKGTADEELMALYSRIKKVCKERKK